MTVIFDTSVWISLFRESDINHDKAKRVIIKESKNKEQIMPDLIFYETITVLRNKSAIEKSILFMDFAKDNNDITIKLFYENNRDIAKLAHDHGFSKLSYVDLLLLYLSKQYTIVTFDKELAKAIELYGGECEGLKV